MSDNKEDNERLEIARKHIKLEEYDKAENILTRLMQNNEFNLEVICELIKTKIEIFKKTSSKFVETSCRYNDLNNWKKIENIIDMYNRAKKIDDNNFIDDELKEYKSQIVHFKDLIKNMENDENECERLTTRLQEIINKCNTQFLKEKDYSNQSSFRSNLAYMLENILGVSGLTFKSNGLNSTFDKFHYQAYYFNNIAHLYRDGSVKVEFIALYTDNINEGTKITGNAKHIENTVHCSSNKIKSIKELENAIDEFEKQANKFLNTIVVKRRIKRGIILTLVLVLILGIIILINK